MAGKISRVGRLGYTPSGTPVLEFTLAAPQSHFDKRSVGNFEIVLVGEAAEVTSGKLRIGRKLTVAGSLWTRTFTNRQAMKVTEIKIIAAEVGEMDTRGT